MPRYIIHCMEHSSDAMIILCTCPAKDDVAQSLATALVESGRVACVNILPQVQSIYRWQGQIENDAEILLIIKSTHDCYEEIEQMLKKLHPYDVPEIIMLPIQQGSSDYLKWLTDAVSNNS